MNAGFRPQKSQQRIPLFGDSAEALASSTGAFRRNQSHIAGQRFAQSDEASGYRVDCRQSSIQVSSNGFRKYRSCQYRGTALPRKVDIDSPRRGIILVEPQNLESLAESLHSQ
jgi:hypothetical protein